MKTLCAALVAVPVIFISTISAAPTINGRAVSVAWRAGGWDYEGVGRGSVVKMTIQNGSVTRCDTIYRRQDGLAQYPAINFAGDKVAFYRWQRETIGTGETFGTSDNSTIAVIDIDGGNLRDLAVLPAQPGEEPVLDWPAGDWIYYKRPQPGANSGERDIADLWRVNVNDPSMNHQVTYYTGWGDHDLLRRWSVSIDGGYAIGQFGSLRGWGNQNIFHTFPPLIGDYAPSSVPLSGAIPGCNGSISASGSYCGWYFGGVHPDVFISHWDHYANRVGGSEERVHVDDIRAWTGQDIGLGGELIRWAVNSDKWVLQQIGWYGHAGSISKGTQQAAANWVDREAIIISGNSKQPDGASPAYGNCPGDLWIDGTAGAYEDVNGNWMPVDAVGPYVKISSTGANPYQITLTSGPQDCEIYYTTDGTAPTQSSTRYTAPFTFNAPEGGATRLCARAYKTGCADGVVSSRLFVPSSKPLPAGYVKELLCLENESGGVRVEWGDTSAVFAKYAGPHKAAPFDGDRVSVNGRTYTWHQRSDSDGIWELPSTDEYFAFLYVNIIGFPFEVNPDGSTPSMVVPKCRFARDPLIWRNGFQVVDFDPFGWDGNNEWDLDRFVLDDGVNGMFVRLRMGWDNAVFAIRLTDGNGDDLTNLRYYPYTGAVKSIRGASVGTRSPRAAVIRATESNLSIVLTGDGNHRVTVTSVAGQTVRAWNGSGAASYRAVLRPGVYLATTVTPLGKFVREVVVR